MRLARFLAPPLALALVLLPSLATASGGVAIRWDQCYGDAGVQNKNFACDTNSGAEMLVGSFVLASALVNTSGLELVIELASASSVLPTWWQFKNPGTCRQGSLSMVITGTGTNCPDWAGDGAGTAGGGLAAYNIGSRGANTARTLMAVAVPPDHLQNLTGLTEYFAFSLVIDHAKTVGTGACGGCTTPVCIVFKSANVVTPILTNNRLLTGPANLTDSDWATWQGGAGVTVGGVTGCPAATPTQQRTWGAVKAIYH